MTRAAIAFVLLALAPAGDGGKIAWIECKNDKDFAKVQADSAYAGRAMLIYFTSNG